jgi:hypothetical protein
METHTDDEEDEFMSHHDMALQRMIDNQKRYQAVAGVLSRLHNMLRFFGGIILLLFEPEQVLDFSWYGVCDTSPEYHYRFEEASTRIEEDEIVVVAVWNLLFHLGLKFLGTFNRHMTLTLVCSYVICAIDPSLSSNESFFISFISGMAMLFTYEVVRNVIFWKSMQQE